VPRALFLLRQFCGSLQEAHQAGFVHRDIKPQNIMVCNCGGETDFVKVVDFGLVKSSEQQPRESGTSVFEWAGTPRYLAPERLLHPRHVDPRSDIYSIGVTTYWMLTETDPFDGAGVDWLLKAIMSEAPRPFPPELAIPVELQEVILRCLAKVPSERFASMAELEAALNAVPNPQPWTELLARDWWQAHLPNLMEIHPIIHNSDPTPSSPSGFGPLSSPQAAVYHTGE
jgi:eukaryotic-like serine/threonine-protein kinase